MFKLGYTVWTCRWPAQMAEEMLLSIASLVVLVAVPLGSLDLMRLKPFGI